LAEQGITETLKMRAGSIPLRWAKKVLVSTPTICWGDLVLDMFGMNSG
jgi:hypothetical protein